MKIESTRQFNLRNWITHRMLGTDDSRIWEYLARGMIAAPPAWDWMSSLKGIARKILFRYRG